uniref:Uncharacterized protein n=1 Tax=viral metagenome TaxID=1070528 RepID=A0A6C0J7F0_9ZZZZ
MQVCYVIIGYNIQSPQGSTGPLDTNNIFTKYVDVSIPGNVEIFGVTYDIHTAREIVKNKKQQLNTKYIMIYNADLIPKKTTDISYPHSIPKWMQ